MTKGLASGGAETGRGAQTLDGLPSPELLATSTQWAPEFRDRDHPGLCDDRALRQENRAVGNGSPSRDGVGRAEDPVSRPEARRGSKRDCSGQGEATAGAGDSGAGENGGLSEERAGRGLVRIKIEDTRPPLTKQALQDAKLVFDNLWATAERTSRLSPETPVAGSGGPFARQPCDGRARRRV